MPNVYPAYSTLFSTIYDEQDPIGNLGRGTHYSVLRSVEWLDVTRTPVTPAQIHDFAVIWDEDHDTRIIEALEKIYMAGLLAPIQFIGERKGCLTVIVAAKYYFLDTEAYAKAIEDIAQNLDDPWPSEVGMFDRSPLEHQCEPKEIIQAPHHNVMLYLKNIDSLWSLGTKDYQPHMNLFHDGYPTPPIPQLA